MSLETVIIPSSIEAIAPSCFHDDGNWYDEWHRQHIVLAAECKLSAKAVEDLRLSCDITFGRRSLPYVRLTGDCSPYVRLTGDCFTRTTEFYGE
jgi:hypothetical protein